MASRYPKERGWRFKMLRLSHLLLSQDLKYPDVDFYTHRNLSAAISSIMLENLLFFNRTLS